MAGNIRVLATPFSTQIPDFAVSHTFVQPIDCLMSNPRPGGTNRVSGTSGWKEGVAPPSLLLLVPVPSGKVTNNLPPYTAGRPKIYQPLRQDANLRPDRKPHHWNSFSPWDPVRYPCPTTNWDMHHAGSKHANVQQQQTQQKMKNRGKHVQQQNG